MASPELSAAYFDESRIDKNNPFPVVAGFWNPVDVWIAFERKLKAEIADKPKGLSLKKYLRSEPVRFAKFISTYTLLPIHATIERKYFKPLFGKIASNQILYDNVYSTCAYMCCDALDEKAMSQKWHKPIKVVFDDGNEYKWALDRGYRKYYAEAIDTRLAKVPLFEDNETTIPLLAGDFYAWLLSRNLNVNDDDDLDVQMALQIIHDSSPPIAVKLDGPKIKELLLQSRHEAEQNNKNREVEGPR
ncbi:MAG TPA: DUF3800 domain-containing protein [Candidatus Eisenbacteria bacterium]|nr:DUF3800 domain-containing protein [Candidatus Eisenbacteria bacterium]